MQERSERQRQIIEASGKILLEKGIKGLTTKQLALEMGFTEGAIYRHFSSKEEIVAALIDMFQQNLTQRLQAISEEETAALEKLRKVFNSQFSFFNQHPYYVIAILSEGLFDESEKMNEEIKKVMSLKTGFLKSIIEDGITQKQIIGEVDAEVLTHMLAGSFRLMILKWKMAAFNFNIEEQGNKTMESIIGLIQS